MSESVHIQSTPLTSLSPPPRPLRSPKRRLPRPHSSPLPADYQSPIRTISPSIINFRPPFGPSAKDVVKGLAPHVLDERRIRRGSLLKSGCPSLPSTPDSEQPSLDQAEEQESQNLLSSTASKGPKPSPLRVSAVIACDEYGNLSLQTPSQSPKNHTFVISPPNSLTPSQTPPIHKRPQTSCGIPSAEQPSSHYLPSVRRSLSMTNLGIENPIAPGEDNGLRKGGWTHKRLRLWPSKMFKKIVVKLKPIINGRPERSR